MDENSLRVFIVNNITVVVVKGCSMKPLKNTHSLELKKIGYVKICKFHQLEFRIKFIFFLILNLYTLLVTNYIEKRKD